MAKIEKFNSAIARAMLPELLDRAKHQKEKFILQRHNKDYAALIPLDLFYEMESRAMPERKKKGAA